MNWLDLLNPVLMALSYRLAGGSAGGFAVANFDFRPMARREIWNVCQHRALAGIVLAYGSWGFNVFSGVRIPHKSEITWKLKDGDFTWLKLEIKDLKCNILLLSQ